MWLRHFPNWVEMHIDFALQQEWESIKPLAVVQTIPNMLIWLKTVLQCVLEKKKKKLQPWKMLYLEYKARPSSLLFIPQAAYNGIVSTPAVCEVHTDF